MKTISSPVICQNRKAFMHSINLHWRIRMPRAMRALRCAAPAQIISRQRHAQPLKL